jgi:hypothetical protein
LKGKRLAGARYEAGPPLQVEEAHGDRRGRQPGQVRTASRLV